MQVPVGISVPHQAGARVGFFEKREKESFIEPRLLVETPATIFPGRPYLPTNLPIVGPRKEPPLTTAVRACPFQCSSFR